MRAVRSQQHGRAVCGQGPLREKKTFFGDFLASTKKLPASRRIAEALALKVQNQKLDSSLRWNDDRENSDLAKIAQHRKRTDTDNDRRNDHPHQRFGTTLRRRDHDRLRRRRLRMRLRFSRR